MPYRDYGTASIPQNQEWNPELFEDEEIEDPPAMEVPRETNPLPSVSSYAAWHWGKDDSPTGVGQGVKLESPRERVRTSTHSSVAAAACSPKSTGNEDGSEFAHCLANVAAEYAKLLQRSQALEKELRRYHGLNGGTAPPQGTLNSESEGSAFMEMPVPGVQGTVPLARQPTVVRNSSSSHRRTTSVAGSWFEQELSEAFRARGSSPRGTRPPMTPLSTLVGREASNPPLGVAPPPSGVPVPVPIGSAVGVGTAMHMPATPSVASGIEAAKAHFKKLRSFSQSQVAKASLQQQESGTMSLATDEFDKRTDRTIHPDAQRAACIIMFPDRVA
mmetsp:Transcript_85596/g.187990  ORF Transcript_85596/g.187990 Transcript_85596/m.187990 type:complete len:331 (-) Transcript_85596:49-1041(-)